MLVLLDETYKLNNFVLGAECQDRRGGRMYRYLQLESKLDVGLKGESPFVV